MVNSIQHVDLRSSAGDALSISRIAFGCGRIFSGPELVTSERLIEVAMEAGIRHFDTAPSYGDGRSEEVLGRVLSGVKDATIATKVGIAWAGRRPNFHQTLYRMAIRPILGKHPKIKSRLLAARRKPSTQELPKAAMHLTRDMILSSLEASLRRLRRTEIDILFVHEPDQFVNLDEILDIFSDLRRIGLFRRYGLAWGRSVVGPFPALDVVQSKISAQEVCGSNVSIPWIFHGFFREAQVDRHYVSSQDVIDRAKQVLSINPRACVLFSASHRSQIQEFVGGVKESFYV